MTMRNTLAFTDVRISSLYMPHYLSMKEVHSEGLNLSSCRATYMATGYLTSENFLVTSRRGSGFETIRTPAAPYNCWAYGAFSCDWESLSKTNAQKMLLIIHGVQNMYKKATYL